MIKRQHYRSNVGGFTLLELLLSVGIIGFVLFSIFQITQRTAEQELAQKASEYMSRVGQAFESALRADPDTFEAAFAQINAAGGTFEYTIADIAPDPSLFGPSSLLDQEFRNISPHGTPITIVARSLGGGTPAAMDDDAIELLVVSNQRYSEKRVRDAAAEAGANGGFFDTLNVATDITSAFNTWQLALGDFAGTAWAANVGLNLPSTANGNYLVYRVFLSRYDAEGDYLYRVAKTNVELHTIFEDLDLNDNNIVGIDNLTDAGTITVNGQVIVQGGARIDRNLTVDGNIVSDTDLMEVTGDLTIDNADAIALLATDYDAFHGGGSRVSVLEDTPAVTLSTYSGPVPVVTETIGGAAVPDANITVGNGFTIANPTGPEFDASGEPLPRLNVEQAIIDSVTTSINRLQFPEVLRPDGNAFFNFDVVIGGEFTATTEPVDPTDPTGPQIPINTNISVVTLEMPTEITAMNIGTLTAERQLRFTTQKPGVGNRLNITFGDFGGTGSTTEFSEIASDPAFDGPSQLADVILNDSPIQMDGVFTDPGPGVTVVPARDYSSFVRVRDLNVGDFGNCANGCTFVAPFP